MRTLLLMLAMLVTACAQQDCTVSPPIDPQPTPSACTGAAVLTWDANSEDNLAGYTIFWGQAEGDYSSSVDVGFTKRKNCPYHILRGLEVGKQYHFTVKAYDSNGDISPPAAPVDLEIIE